MPEARAFRKCHVCDHVDEAAATIKRCGGCGKPFAPFYYYDDALKPIYAAAELRPVIIAGPETWHPIQGLTAYWSAE